MPLKRFALYFLSISGCAVALFPTVVPTEAPSPEPSFAAASNFSNFYPVPPYDPEQAMKLTILKKAMSHRKSSGPVTLVASN